jgi:hypothetical protein
MSFEALKIMMSAYHVGDISHIEMAAAIHLWQRRMGFIVADLPEGCRGR